MITEEIEMEESKAAEVTAECEITIRYHEIGKGIQEIKLPKGDLYVICNVLYDYVDLLRVTSESQELEIHKELYKLHADRCEKIRHKIEHKLGCCVEKAIKNARKRKTNPEMWERMHWCWQQESAKKARKSHRRQRKKQHGR